MTVKSTVGTNSEFLGIGLRFLAVTVVLASLPTRDPLDLFVVGESGEVGSFRRNSNYYPKVN